VGWASSPPFLYDGLEAHPTIKIGDLFNWKSLNEVEEMQRIMVATINKLKT
jgi:hypothetical protein